jgi:pimeloyl-ACP methyl ester carboxylesterase
MKFRAFGDTNLPAIVLLHGGGLSWWSLQKIVNQLQSHYHVITPIIDGHGEDGEEIFISIEDSANKLIQFIDSELGGKVFALGGLSLGAQIVVEILSCRDDIAHYAIIESALVLPLPYLSLLVPITYKLCYGLMKKKWFSRLQAKTLFVPDELYQHYYEDSLKVSRQSLINIALSNSNYRLKQTIRNTQSRVLIIVGEKELPAIKKSAYTLHKAIPASTLYFAPKMRHGELSLAHPSKYVKIIRSFFAN